MTYDDPNIFYISLHRKGRTSLAFFPGTGHHAEVGKGEAVGMNLNVAWTKSGVGNIEYAAAFTELILPLIVEYEPDLILVSCGFDAAAGDLLGDCTLTPHMYYCMTKSILRSLGEEIPIVIALEGGYNVNVICNCMEAVALALLDEPWGNENSFSMEPQWELPQDYQSSRELMKSGYKAEKLRSGRQILACFWDYETSNVKKKGCGAKDFAVNAINQSMSCIQRTPFWNDRGLDLVQIKTQSEIITMTTRRTRSSKVDVALKDIGTDFGKMDLDK